MEYIGCESSVDQNSGLALMLENIQYSTGISFVCLFAPSLSSCHEKATVALYFGRVRSAPA